MSAGAAAAAEAPRKAIGGPRAGRNSELMRQMGSETGRYDPEPPALSRAE